MSCSVDPDLRIETFSDLSPTHPAGMVKVIHTPTGDQVEVRFGPDRALKSATAAREVALAVLPQMQQEHQRRHGA